jgi:hypothetical protein
VEQEDDPEASPPEMALIMERDPIPGLLILISFAASLRTNLAQIRTEEEICPCPWQTSHKNYLL